MGEFKYDSSRETAKLEYPGSKKYEELEGEERVMEAILSQPQEVRDHLQDVWHTYKAMIQDGQGGILGVAEQRFFDEVLAKGNTVPPDFEMLVGGANFPKNKGAVTQPIKGTETMAEGSVDLTSDRHNAVIKTPEELAEEK